MAFHVLVFARSKVPSPATSPARGPASDPRSPENSGRWADEDSSEDEETGPASLKIRNLTSAGAGEHVTRVQEVSGVRLFRANGVALPGQPFGGTSPMLGHSRCLIEDALPIQRTSSLLLVAVPSEVALPSLELFFGDSLAGIEELIVLHRSCSSGKQSSPGDFYSVVVQCRSQETADIVYQANHGRFFFDDDRPWPASPAACSAASAACEAEGGPCCYLVFLDSVAYLPGSAADADEERVAKDAVPVASYELPACPFCLERVDVSGTGMVTHNHGWLSALTRGHVPDARCCVACAMITRHGSGDSTESCRNCGKAEELWACLICGHPGCGRYAHAHAKDHAELCKHRFCLELATGRIWDYNSDVFVHRRLVQMAAASGGQLFDLMLPEAAGTSSSSRDVASKQRAAQEDSLAMELDAILASQLEYQRSVHEAKLGEAVEAQCRAVRRERAVLDKQMSTLADIEAQVVEAEKKNRAFEKQAAAADKVRRITEEQLEFVKELNKSLLANRKEMAKSESAEKPVDVGIPDEKEDTMLTRLQKRIDDVMGQISALDEDAADAPNKGVKSQKSESSSAT